MIFCHKTHFCGRYSAPDLRQTGGPCVLRGYFCTLIWHSQACLGLVCHPARFARWVAIIKEIIIDSYKCLNPANKTRGPGKVFKEVAVPLPKPQLDIDLAKNT